MILETGLTRVQEPVLIDYAQLAKKKCCKKYKKSGKKQCKSCPRQDACSVAKALMHLSTVNHITS